MTLAEICLSSLAKIECDKIKCPRVADNYRGLDPLELGVSK